MKLSDYAKTKPSAFKGLGHLPNHWEVIRGRFVMRVNPPAPRLRNLKPEDEVSFVPMDAVGEYGGLNLDQTRVISDVSSGFTEFQDGDVVVAKITPCFENGKAALARGLLNGAAYGTTELHVLRAGDKLNRGFLFYVAISDRFRKLGESEMYGAGGQKRVPPEFNKDFPMPVPPVPEQLQIAAFLDWKTGQIDALMARKKELLDKLKEKRVAVITQAVTQGLNPAAIMRDSGIPCLGQVPQHWEVKRGRFAMLVNPSAPQLRGLRPEDEVSFVPMDAVGVQGGLSLEQTRVIGDVSGGYTEFQDGDVIVAKITPCFENGKAALASDLKNGAAYGTTELHVLRADSNLEQQFLFYVVISDTFLKLGESEMYGAGGQKRVPPEFPKDYRIAVPPLGEQKEIAEYLNAEMTSLDELICRVQAVVERLEEYRNALITAATTGKIDVRNVKIPQLAA